MYWDFFVKKEWPPCQGKSNRIVLLHRVLLLKRVKRIFDFAHLLIRVLMKGLKADHRFLSFLLLKEMSYVMILLSRVYLVKTFKYGFDYYTPKLGD